MITANLVNSDLELFKIFKEAFVSGAEQIECEAMSPEAMATLLNSLAKFKSMYSGETFNFTLKVIQPAIPVVELTPEEVQAIESIPVEVPEEASQEEPKRRGRKS